MRSLDIQRPRRPRLVSTALPEIWHVAFFTASAYVLTWAKLYVVIAYEISHINPGYIISLALAHISILMSMTRSFVVVASGVKLRYTLYINRRNAGKRV